MRLKPKLDLALHCILSNLTLVVDYAARKEDSLLRVEAVWRNSLMTFIIADLVLQFEIWRLNGG